MTLAEAPQAPLPPRADVAMLLAQLLQHASAVMIRRENRGPLTAFTITCETRRPGGSPALEVALPTETVRLIRSFDPHAEMVRNLVTAMHDSFGI